MKLDEFEHLKAHASQRWLGAFVGETCFRKNMFFFFHKPTVVQIKPLKP